MRQITLPTNTPTNRMIKRELHVVLLEQSTADVAVEQKSFLARLGKMVLPAVAQKLRALEPNAASSPTTVARSVYLEPIRKLLVEDEHGKEVAALFKTMIVCQSSSRTEGRLRRVLASCDSGIETTFQCKKRLLRPLMQA